MTREEISKGDTVYRNNLPVVVHEILGGDQFVIKFGESFLQRETVHRDALETYREINDRKDAEYAERDDRDKMLKKRWSKPE